MEYCLLTPSSPLLVRILSDARLYLMPAASQPQVSVVIRVGLPPLKCVLL